MCLTLYGSWQFLHSLSLSVLSCQVGNKKSTCFLWCGDDLGSDTERELRTVVLGYAYNYDFLREVSRDRRP